MLMVQFGDVYGLCTPDGHGPSVNYSIELQQYCHGVMLQTRCLRLQIFFSETF